MKNRKAEAANFGPKTNFTGGETIGFSSNHYKKIVVEPQCKKCGSDYLRFSLNGYCQRCQQLAEHLRRERTAKGVIVRFQNGGEK